MKKKVLIVSPVVSHPALSGNSTRIAQMVACLTEMGCEVHFLLCPISTIQDRRHGAAMAEFYGDRYSELGGGHINRGGALRRVWNVAMRLGLKKIRLLQDTTVTSGLFPRRLRRDFSELVDRINPDVLIFEYVLMAGLAASVGKSRKKIVDTHDRFSNRNQRIRSAGGSGTWWSLRPAQEVKLLSEFDCAIAIQQEEQQLFQEALRRSTTEVLLVDILHAPSHRHMQGTPSNGIVGYIGSNNKHNIEGLMSFVENQWPEILRVIPDAKLVVAGGISTNAHIPNAIFVGRVEDLWNDFYKNCAIVVNPCLSGTGLKIKTIEAMSYGVPVVTTAEGCTGIEAAIEQGLFCKDMASTEFHQTCIELLQDQAQRAFHSTMARKYIEVQMENSVRKLKSIVQ